MKGDARYFGQLARDGFEVYVYDLVGRGSSSRLAEPQDYTLGRDVRDLEEVRRKIGVYALLLPPRPMPGYTILQVNPEAAHSFAGDAEMDARFDRVYN